MGTIFEFRGNNITFARECDFVYSISSCGDHTSSCMWCLWLYTDFKTRHTNKYKITRCDFPPRQQFMSRHKNHKHALLICFARVGFCRGEQSPERRGVIFCALYVYLEVNNHKTFMLIVLRCTILWFVCLDRTQCGDVDCHVFLMRVFLYVEAK